MGLPPAHRCDHAPIYVLDNDTAWDSERIKYEYEVIRKKREPEPGRAEVTWTSVEDHPVAQYHRGASRADYETVRAYIDDAGEPVRFVLRRLGLNQWAELETRRSISLPRARIYAIRWALVSVEGCETYKPDRGGREAGPLTDADAQALRELIGDTQFVQLCDIAILASQEPTPPEKKP